MFENLDFINNFRKNSTNLDFYQTLYKNLDFRNTFRKISILVTVFERTRFKIEKKMFTFFLNYIEYTHNVQIISIVY